MGIILDLPRCNRRPNTLANVAGFLQACRKPLDPENTRPLALRRTPAGSINDDGREGSFRARSLTPHHPQFVASLEPDIAPLVVAFFNLGLVTYTSCEGHILDGGLYEAHVGILVAPGSEPRQFAALLKSVDGTGLTPMSHAVWDPEGGREYETLELYVREFPGSSYRSYRSTVRETVGRALSALAEHAASIKGGKAEVRELVPENAVHRAGATER